MWPVRGQKWCEDNSIFGHTCFILFLRAFWKKYSFLLKKKNNLSLYNIIIIEISLYPLIVALLSLENNIHNLLRD